MKLRKEISQVTWKKPEFLPKPEASILHEVLVVVFLAAGIFFIAFFSENTSHPARFFFQLYPRGCAALSGNSIDLTVPSASGRCGAAVHDIPLFPFFRLDSAECAAPPSRETHACTLRPVFVIFPDVMV